MSAQRWAEALAEVTADRDHLRGELEATRAALADLREMQGAHDLAQAAGWALDQLRVMRDRCPSPALRSYDLGIEALRAALEKAGRLAPAATPAPPPAGEPCAQCGRPTDPDTAGVYFRREFCGAACLEEFRRPVPGKVATYVIGSDSYAYTILTVSPSGHRLGVRPDHPGMAQLEYAHRNRQGHYNLGRAGRLYVGAGVTHRDQGF